MRFPLHPAVRACLILFSLFLLPSCSIEDMIVGPLADALSSGMGESFTGEDDPELVGDALPFALKLYDSLLEKTPRHVNLLLSTGSAYIMYANAFVQTKAETLPQRAYQEKKLMMTRAKRFYLRGFRLVMRALEVKYPGFETQLYSKDSPVLLERCVKADVPLLYWGAAGLFAAYATDVLDVSLSLKLSRTVLLMEKALSLDEGFQNGAIHDFFISYYASMPSGMGGNDAKARKHFERALEVSRGQNPSPYVSFALSMSVKRQDRAQCRELLEKALAIDPDQNPEGRLAAIIIQRKARWYLEHLDDFFI